MIKLESHVKQYEYDISSVEGFIPYFNIEHFSTSFNFFMIFGSILSSFLLYISITSLFTSSSLNKDRFDLIELKLPFLAL